MRHNKRQKRTAQEARNGSVNEKQKAGALLPDDTRLQITDEDVELFVMIPKSAWEMGLSNAQFMVYASLKYYANGAIREPGVFPSYQTLAERADLGRSTVIRAIRVLVEKGMVRVKKQKTGSENVVNHYTLLAAHKWKRAADSPGVVPERHQGWCQSDTRGGVTVTPEQELGYQETAAANLGSTVVREAEPPDTPPPDPEENSLLAAYLEREQFNPEEKLIVKTFKQTNNLSEDQVYTVLLDLAQEGVHKDGLVYAMKETTRIGPTNVIPYLYSVAKANPVGGPVNEPVSFDTEGRRENGQSGQHVPTSQLPDAKTIYERIKHKPWDFYTPTGGLRYLTLRAFELKDNAKNEIWFDNRVRELKSMRRKASTVE